MKSSYTIILTLYIFQDLLLVSSEVQQQPLGAQVRITQEGLNYAAGVAVDVLTRNIQGRPVPAQTGIDRLDVGSVKWMVKDIKITGFTKPTTSVELSVSDAMVWTMAGGGIQTSGQWRYEYRLWRIKVRDMGAFTLDVQGLSVNAKVKLERGRDGKPRVKVLSCASSIANLDVQFIGGRDWLYNLFSSAIKWPIQNELEKAVCEEATKSIEDSGNEELVSLGLQVPIDGSDIIVDCSLLEDPVIGDGYIKTSHKAIARLVNSTDTLSIPVQFTPISIQNDATPTRMITLIISEYSANTIGYLFHNQGKLTYLLTREDIRSESAKAFLGTSCTSTTCFGSLFPGASILFPNAIVELNMTSIEPPTLQITPAGAVGRFRGRLEVLGKLAVLPMMSIMSLDVSAELYLNAEMQGNFIKATVSRLVPTISVEDSKIGLLSPTKLRELLQYAANNFIIPQLNEVLKGGFNVPSMEGLEFVDPTLTLVNGGLMLSTDVRYNPVEQ